MAPTKAGKKCSTKRSKNSTDSSSVIYCITFELRSEQNKIIYFFRLKAREKDDVMRKTT